MHTGTNEGYNIVTLNAPISIVADESNITKIVVDIEKIFLNNEGEAYDVIATNTTISRADLKTKEADITAIGNGGLSGKPAKTRSTEVIRYLNEKSNGQIVIIGVGGIASAEDAIEKINAGASLVQVYSGLVYEGPGLIKKINKGILKMV